MRELIKTLLNDVIRKITPEFKGSVSVEVPENKEHGDYTSNIAFYLSKILSAKGETRKKSPQKVAEELAKKIKSEEFSKVEAKNGFVNFYLSEECLHHQLKEILKPQGPTLKNPQGRTLIGHRMLEKVNIEFISANPTGPLTIGNGRGGFFGDVLANVLESQGYNVAREYYINDRGEQVLALGKSVKGSNLYKGKYIKELAKQIDRKLNDEEAGQKTAELILNNYIKPVIKKLGIKFNVWFSEKTLYKKGIYNEVMKKLMQSGYVYEKDGATWMKTLEFGDNEDRVLIKKDGEETYFLSDILYHYDKFKTRKFNKAIDIWGADHHGYAPRLKAALKALGISEENLEIVISQLVRLVSGGKEVKVSKRAGTFITLEELVDEVGLDAARFFFLMYSPNTHMDFDMKLAKERSQKNPVYYVQYAHARLSSILRKAPAFAKATAGKQNFKLLKTKNESDLIRRLVEYPEILAEIAKTYKVHRLPRYALELAREFHNFYEKERVITEDKKLTSARLALVTATKIVLANSLKIMGITAPEKM